MRYIICFMLLAMVTGACNKEKKQAKKDKKAIEQYIKDHNLSASSTESGLYYVIESTGTGTQPGVSSKVTVAYKGYLTDGTVFDESASTGITFGLTSVIEGWQEGIPLFKEGGSGKLLIPSGLGYGSRAKGKIPANSVLIFDVTLIDVL